MRKTKPTARIIALLIVLFGFGSLKAQNCDAKFDFAADPNDTKKIDFFNQSTTTAGQIIEYDWDFGNGKIDSIWNPSHTYTNSGTFNVTLVIKTQEGCSDTLTKSVIAGGLPCKADFDFHPESADGKTVKLEDRSTSPGGITTFSWDFEGNWNWVDTSSHVSNTYGEYKSYTACLAIQGNQCIDSICKTIEVKDPNVKECSASFGHKNLGNGNFEFTDSSTVTNGNITTWKWKFGDGNEATTQNATHTYTAEDNYTGCLEIKTDKGCEDMHCDFIVNSSKSCHAEFSWDKGTGAFDYNFQSHVLNEAMAQTYWWKIENQEYTTKNTAHTFTAVGTYEVTFAVVNNDGCADTVKHTIEVTGGSSNCHADFEWSFKDNGMTLVVNDKSNAGSGVKTWDYDVKDNGTTYNTGNFEHNYANQGFYDVCLAIEANDGCKDTICRNIEIKQGGAPCGAAFNWDFSNGGMTINTHDNSYANSGIKTWSYNSGDNNLSYTTSTMTHGYPSEGNYNVCLAIEANDGCKDTVCHNIEIKQDSTNGGGDKLNPIGNCGASIWVIVNNDYRTIDLQSHSGSKVGPINYSWSLSDGATYTTETAKHTFTNDGDESACLMIESNGCKDTACVDLKIKPGDNCHASFHPLFDPNNPKKVQFVLNGTDNLTGGYWDLGDGAKSTEKYPVHEYDKPGFYQVCVNALDSTSGCQVSFCQPIEIKGQGGENNNCFSEFEFVTNNLAVTFNNKSQGQFTKVKWEFGDGTSSENHNEAHTFAQPGVYDVCLTVFNDSTNCVSHHCKQVAVTDGNTTICKADFNFFPIGERKFQFDNASEGTFTHAKWDASHGAFVEAKDATFEFPGPGYYDVCLSIFDSVSNCMNSICKKIEVEDSNKVNCLAEFEFFKEPNKGVQFNNKSQGAFTNAHWAFGDGGFSDDINPHHIFNHDGHFDVCLSVKDSASGCFDQICKKVAIMPDTANVYCEAKFDGFKDPNGEIVLNNMSTGNISEYFWEFGNGHISHDKNPKFKYDKPGYYKLCLTVIDTISGCQATHCEEIHYVEDTTTATCLAKYEFFVDKNKITLKDQSVGNYSNIHWDFGDGKFADGVSEVTHEYTATGYYNVCIGIYDTISGCQDYQCTQIAIVKDTADVYCKAGFKKMILADGSIHLSNEGQGSFQKVHWDFGNGDFADTWDVTSEGPVAPGTYHVCMSVWDTINGCQDTYCEDVTILGNDTAPKCMADFQFFPKTKTEMVFENTSVGKYTNVHWEFGDGKFSDKIDAKVTHDYANGGYFKVCLAVYDSATGCQAQVCKDIDLVIDTTVVDCHAKIEFFPTTSTGVTLKNASKGAFNKAYWEFSNGDISYDINPTIDFGGAGLHGACLTIKDSVSGCQDRVCIEIPLIDTNTTYCNAHFKYMVTDKVAHFKPEMIGNVTGWVWEFNDGYTSQDTTPSHMFEHPGIYDVCLTVFDSTSKCFNTYCEQVEIIGDTAEQSNFCKANFSYYVNPNSLTVEFKDESQGNIDSWYWNFGDNDSAGVVQNPKYTFPENGYYEVCLTIKTSAGCQENICKVIPVGDVSKSCFAKFNYFADSVTSTAHFNNASIGNITSYAWEFGDSVKSVQFQPSHTYADTGFYAVCLTVENNDGCKKSFCKEVRVGNALANPCIIGCVWPGDANADLEANHYDILPIGLHFGETGPKRDNASETWYGQKAEDWSVNLWGSVNNKHNDCNGDGVIGIEDLDVLKNNFAYSRPWQPKAGATNLKIDWDVEDIEVGETATLIVSLPDTTTTTIYGLGFEIDLDPNVFDYSTINYDFSNSFLGTVGNDLITFTHSDQNLGNVYIAESRNDHQETTGTGELVRITVVAKSTSNGSKSTTLTTEGGVKANGDTLTFSGQSTNANVNSIDERQGYKLKELVVFPNPTTGEIRYNVPTGSNIQYNIEVRDNIGKIVYSDIVNNGGQITSDLSHLRSGIYSITVATEKVKYVQKVVINK